MTDEIERVAAPERIWAEPGMPGYTDEPNEVYTVGYVRADLTNEAMHPVKDRPTTPQEAAKVLTDVDRENIVDEIESIICETHEMDVRDVDYAENIVSWLERHHPAALRAIAGEVNATTPKPSEVTELEAIDRLLAGDRITFSMDGDEAWFTEGDHAPCNAVVQSLRAKGYLRRVVDEDCPRGFCWDEASDRLRTIAGEDQT